MKKIFSFFAVCSIALVGAFSCTKVDVYEDVSNPLPVSEETTDAVQGLSISPKNNYVVVGETIELTVTCQPETAQPGTVTWTSSDENVAKVDANGVVTTLSTGIAKIVATAGGSSVTALVNVYAERIPATEIALSKTEITIREGQFSQIRARLLPDGSDADVPGTTDRLNVEWTSSDESVATVSYGLVRAVGKGTATITAKQGDLTAACALTVNAKAALVDKSSVWTVTDTPVWNATYNGISASEVVSLSGCDALYHVFRVVDASKFTDVESLAADYFLQVDEAREAGSDPARLFSKGESQTISYSDQGEAVAYVLGFDENYDFTGEYVVYNFTARTPEPGVYFLKGSYNAEGITELTLKEGKTSDPIRALYLPETAGMDVTLSMEDPEIASLAPYYSNYYQITGNAVGQTRLVAKAGGKEYYLKVTVTENIIVMNDRSDDWTITATQEKMERWGYTYTYNYVTLLSCSAPKHYMTFMREMPSNLKTAVSNAIDAGQQYGGWYLRTVMPDKVSTNIESGYVLILGFDDDNEYTGDYALHAYNCKGDTGEIATTSLTISPSPAEVEVGKTVTLKVTLLPADHTDNPTVEWFSYDEDIATVDDNGVVTGVAAGTATIVAYTDSDIEAEVTVTVKEAAQPVGGKVVNMKTAFFDYTWPSSLATLDEVTMETWVNTAGNPGKNESIMGIEGVFLLRTEDSQFQLICGGTQKSNGEYNEVKLATAWTTGEWVHLAAVYSRSARKAYLYVNGEQKATATLQDHGVDMNGVGAKWNLPFSFIIGNACDGNRYVQGTIAHARVWKCARTASEIKDNMRKEASGSDLIAYWKFNEGSGNTIADHSGAGRTLTGKKYESQMNYPTTTVEWIDGTLPF